MIDDLSKYRLRDIRNPFEFVLMHFKSRKKYEKCVCHRDNLPIFQILSNRFNTSYNIIRTFVEFSTIQSSKHKMICKWFTN